MPDSVLHQFQQPFPRSFAITAVKPVINFFKSGYVHRSLIEKLRTPSVQFLGKKRAEVL